MLHLAHELQPVHPRHGDVGDQQVGREMLQRLQRGRGVEAVCTSQCTASVFSNIFLIPSRMSCSSF